MKLCFFYFDLNKSSLLNFGNNLYQTSFPTSYLNDSYNFYLIPYTHGIINSYFVKIDFISNLGSITLQSNSSNSKYSTSNNKSRTNKFLENINYKFGTHSTKYY